MPHNAKNTPKKILILGDSTLDNRVWLGKEIVLLFLGTRFFFSSFLSFIIRCFAALVPSRFRPKSVVEQLRLQMPEAQIIDRSNDGFTTTDLLNGAYKDKVFGEGSHRFFPHEVFKPLDTNAIETADQIILSIGGNNFREFILAALSITNEQEQAEYIKQNYPRVFEKMTQEYKQILKYIAQKNPKANLILLTQYYPALNQTMGFGNNLYDFMGKLGKILNKGTAQDAIVDVMKETYTNVFKFITNDPELRDLTVTVVDATSTLNPHDSRNYVFQIEPSSQGGKQIAAMLSCVTKRKSDGQKTIYRFAPEFFRIFLNRNSFQHRFVPRAKWSDYVYTHPLSSDFTFVPVHPKDLNIKKSEHSRGSYKALYAFNKHSEPDKTVNNTINTVPPNMSTNISTHNTSQNRNNRQTSLRK